MWKDERFGESRPVDPAALIADYGKRFGLNARASAALERWIQDWHTSATDESKNANLVGTYYGLLHLLGVAAWDLDDPAAAARLGTLARFSHLLADFEHVKRRARRVEENGREVHHGGTNGGRWFYRQLFNYLQYYALDAYEGFAGEDNPFVDAVAVLTVHQAKGLEWPVVYIPALLARRFPSSATGRKQEWLLPEALFPKSARNRYEGSEADERRLFYVAMTRARDALFLSCFRRTAKTRAKPSPFFAGIAGDAVQAAPLPLLPARPARSGEAAKISLPFSDLAAYERCPLSYRLRSVLGFEPQLAEELGYGRAVHGVLRGLAALAQQTHRVPTAAEAEQVLEAEFYLPFARRPAFEQMKEAARGLIRQYLAQYSQDLLRTWDTERPLELQVPGGAVQGRADVILSREGGGAGALALADYKTASDKDANDLYAFQLAIYAAAAREEGLDVRAAYLHELDAKAPIRRAIPVGESETKAAVTRAGKLVKALAARRFPPQPTPATCARCDVSAICAHTEARA